MILLWLQGSWSKKCPYFESTCLKTNMCETSKSDNTIIKDLGLVKTQILLVQLTLVIHKVIRMNITLANSKNTSYTISHYANG